VISLVLGMIGARRAQALTVWLLSALATAAAVAGPVALRAVDLAIVRYEVDAATAQERSISVAGFVNPSSIGDAGQFDAIASLVGLPGFEAVRSGEIEAFGPVRDGVVAAGKPTSRVVFRDRVCQHLVIVAGRCAAGALEVMVGADTAERVGLRPGDVTVVQAARAVEGAGLVPDGAEARLTVVGVYRPRDAEEAYWAGQRYFPILTDGTRREPVFLTIDTLDLIEHALGQSAVDAFLPPERLTLDRVDTLPDEILNVTQPIGESAQGIIVSTDLPALVDRIDNSRDLARQLVPVAFIPLVALCWFVIFLAVAAGVFGRRTELGLVVLRGVRPVRRWWLATGETALAILAGVPVGYVLGYLVVGQVARWRLGGSAGTELDLAGLPYAALALVGALLVALWGQRTTLRASVVDLLRGVPRRGGAWRSATVEALVLVLAVVATVQLRTSGQGGVALLVPGLVVAGVALLAARALTPIAGLVARRALRNGRLGTGLAAIQLARRPGSHRLFVLLAVASAMLTFVAAGVDVAGQAREDRAYIATGATRVVTVDGADARRLLTVTRTVDPAGAWAMAVVPVPQNDPEAPEVLAVDTTRLGVAEWRPEFLDGGEGAVRGLGERLRGSLAEPFVLRGTGVSLDVTLDRLPNDPPLDVTFTFATLDDGDDVGATLTDLGHGRVTRRVDVPACDIGCRLTGITTQLERNEQLRLTVHAIRQVEPPADVVSPADLARRERWRTDDEVRLIAGAGGLQIATLRSPFDEGLVRVAAVDGRVPVPVAAIGALPPNRQLTSLDGLPVLATVVTRPVALPRLGPHGALVDLDYLTRSMLMTPRRERAEVWLGPSAPADAPERLRRAGLAVSRTTGIEANQQALARQGPALALHFHVAAAGLGLLLGLGGLVLVATVERRRQGDDLRALRRQGLARRFVRRAALWGYLFTVLAATVAGLVAAAAAWVAAGDRLPIFTDVGVLRPPRWPDPVAVLVPWLAATAVLVISSVVIGWALRRTVLRRLNAGRGS
jgi:putative ABC transport system permease protein